MLFLLVSYTFIFYFCMQSIYWDELLESISIEGVKETGLCRDSS